MNRAQRDFGTKRWALEQAIQQMEDAISSDNANPPDEDEIHSIMKTLKRCHSRMLNASDTLIDALLKTNANDNDCQDAERIQATLNTQAETVLLKASKHLRKAELDAESITSAHTVSRQHHRFPKLELPKFGGEAREWLQFWSQFENINKDDSISTTMKFQYLIQCMKEGSPSEELVKSYPVTEENYPLVIISLQERFGREDMLVEVYVREIINLILENAVRKTSITFSSLYVKLSSQLRALGTLGVTTDKCASILYPMVESALSEDVFVAWERYRTQHATLQKQTSEQHLEKLMEFLKHEVAGKERIKLAREGFTSTGQESSHSGPAQKQNSNKRQNATAASLLTVEEDTRKKTCLFCENTNHQSENCRKAQTLSLEERQKLVRDKRRCFTCLKAGHGSKKCRSSVQCIICGKRHWVIVCPDVKSHHNQLPNKMDGDNHVQVTNSTPSLLTNQVASPDVLLQTLVVKVVGKNKSKNVRALMDSGSEKSYILHRTAQEVGLEEIGEEQIVHMLFGGVSSSPQKHSRFKITLSDVDSTLLYKFDVSDIMKIAGHIKSVPKGPWLQELQGHGIQLTDVDKNNQDIEVLIGSDVMGKLITGKKIELSSGPVALQTLLGWTLMGKLPVMKTSADSTLMVHSYHVREKAITDLWSLDVIGIADPIEQKTRQELEASAVTHFQNTVKQTEDGRYEVRLPWISDHPPLATNRSVAEKRLVSATQKLKQQNMVNGYDEVFTTWLRDGVIERVPLEEEAKYGHYLPHRAVLKPESSTTPIRPVFDASAKTKGSPSLNECLEKGPNLLEDIPAILTRFRVNKIGIVSDIKKAFLQMNLHKADRDYLRFLWWSDTTCSRMIIFRHCRVVFGVSSSPFLLGATLNHHLETCETKFKSTAQRLQESFYVDNCVTSLPTMESALNFKQESQQLLSKAQFDLRGWEVSSVDQEQCESKIVPVLGLSWNLQNDELSCDLRGAEKYTDGPTTKRKILSLAHMIFDPLGFTCPFTIIPKMLLQEVWKLRTGWDDELPEEISKKFEVWKKQIKDLKKMKIPRYFANCDDKSSWSLHVFTDASKSAYAAVVYLRTESEDVSVQLVMAKARVAPLKTMTIPKLELMSCTIGARLAVNVKNMIGIPNISIQCWSDSSTALAWIKREENWNRFVNNRVNEIRSLTDVNCWSHVPGSLNPADIPSRGSSVKALLQLRWWEGPPWLKKNETLWPKTAAQVNEEEVNQEKKKTVTTALVSVEEESIFKTLMKFSDYHQILRVMAYVKRFINNTRSRRRNREVGTPFPPITKEIQNEEMDSAELTIVRYIQKTTFGGIRHPHLQRLRAFEDVNGMIRIKTRLYLTEKNEEFTCPLLLPSKHVFVQKIIWKYHKMNCHAGVQTLQTQLRSRFWIINSRRTIRNVILYCAKCRRFRAQPIQVETPPLPKDRVKVGSAFEVTGVDLAGPLFLKGNKKIWIALFTCATYRAIHLEIVSNLTTEAFLKAFRRFVSRRGRPKTIYSDNGLNFVGCDNLFRAVDWTKIQKYANTSNIKWKFNPPSASWWGGWWERLIGVVKQLLRSVLGSSRVNFEDMETLLCDVESTVNNRPLTYVSEDTEELIPLTPDHFIRNSGTAILPEVDLIEREKFNAQYQNMQNCRDELRSRFRKEYLALLIHSGKQKKTRVVKIGDVVLIGNDLTKRLEWPMGIVREVIPGRDGVVRVVRVQTTRGEYLRPVQRLFPLEINEDVQSVPENLQD